ncbi:MAG TPA: CehA/McbA family metallohydrolase [Pirellulaceae bacterium]|nr:CehA/McbA family metallohydrolase [Pirellulaceae bacterium]
MRTPMLMSLVGLIAALQAGFAEDLPVISVEGQPLAANVRRVVQALDLMGQPLPSEVAAKLEAAAKERDHAVLQSALDKHVLLAVAINPESRVKVVRGPAEAKLQQGGYTPVIVKIVNEGAITKRLKIVSPQAGPVYAGAAQGSLLRQQQTELGENPNAAGDKERFLGVEMFAAPPLSDKLSGLEVEYMLALIYCHESGKREATIGFDVEQGNQDLGFRGETAVLFDVANAYPITVVADDDFEPTIVKMLIRDEQGHVYPPQAKRLAPDLFFQPHIYRASNETILLPPGKFTVSYSRGPEYRVVQRPLTVKGPGVIDIDLKRWVDPAFHGFYSGDHHIHAAGCAHYTSPTEGVLPEHMFRQVKGEGLNVGCVLTWGPCYKYQRQFFQERPHDLSEPLTLLKYDIEISGFGSQALGHVCLLNLKDQTYPGSEGTETKGWPSWATPAMRWCKEQGGVTGYAHSASGLWIDEKSASERMLTRYDADKSGELSAGELAGALLPEPFERIDADKSRQVNLSELMASHARAAEQLPNLAIPEMNGAGAMELPVSVAEGVCDFISAMDTRRIQEWNTWYHVLNCGFPLKASGETDFPCMSSRNVGQGRVYVRLGDVERIDYTAWCNGIAAGRSYVSDGYAHALEFAVNKVRPGEGEVRLTQPGNVSILAKVAFAEETPLAVAHGGIIPPAGKSVVGDTVVLHGPRSEEMLVGGKRLVELVINGVPAASREVPADGNEHDLQFEVPIAKSSWVALRQFPQLHTNPVNVVVADRPIRASADSARWCIEAIDLLWKNREKNIKPQERAEAQAAFDRARERYRQIAAEASEG